MFGAALLGAVTVPINARYQPPELAYVVENADLKVLLTTDKIADAVNFVERLNQAFPDLAGADSDTLQIAGAPMLTEHSPVWRLRGGRHAVRSRI